ncbi:MAG TPA: SDR family NAD(P)-dependent oxidoreductase [Chloroflexota bacterium]|jgi:NAD(P)-dependent dehydrogenase (short-subunit alcohol dehydrogenase family)
MPIDGRVAIVTGAGSGIGRAICLQLAREGVHVAAVDLDPETAAATARAVSELGRASQAHGLDVADRAAVQAMADQVRGAWGRIDVLVACAGINFHRSVLETTEADWDRLLDTHLKGTLFCVQAVLPTMMEQRSGRIVTTVSGQAQAGRPGTAAYATAKGGLISFTKVLGKEAEPYGITVNAFGPGVTDTPMVRKGNSPEQLARIAAEQAPFGVLPTAEQSAELAVWFTRPETAHITGRIFL